MKKSDNIALHSTATHGPAFLFKLIDAAIWLLCRDNGARNVEIVLHPLEVGNSTITAAKKWAYWIRQPRAAIVKQMQRKLLQGVSRFQPGVSSHRTQADLNFDRRIETSGSIYESVYGFNGNVQLLTSVGGILISRASCDQYLSKQDVKNVRGVTRQLWAQCHKGRKLQATRFLTLEYEDIQIGDLVASYAIRKYPQAGGSLQYCKGLYSTLESAVAICEYTKGYLRATSPKEQAHLACVTVPEPTYLHGLYQRLLNKSGFSLLTLHDYADEFAIVPDTDLAYNPRFFRRAQSRPLSAPESQQAAKYLEERLAKPTKHLWYMTEGTNRDDEGVYDAKDSQVRLEPSSVYAALFLHSFDDGQYWYGIDGFADIFEWTMFTIDRLLEAREIANIFVKPHPNVNYARYPGDKIAYNRLQKLYQGNPRIVWLRKDVGPKAFAKHHNIVGITHHGSIAEELCFLGVPVIGAACAPWGADAKFLFVWKTPEEYKTILSDIAKRVDQFADTWTMRTADLLEYVYRTRCNVPTYPERNTWGKFARWRDGVEEVRRAQYEHYNAKLSKLSVTEDESIRFLEYIVSCHRK